MFRGIGGQYGWQVPAMPENVKNFQVGSRRPIGKWEETRLFSRLII